MCILKKWGVAKLVSARRPERQSCPRDRRNLWACEVPTNTMSEAPKAPTDRLQCMWGLWRWLDRLLNVDMQFLIDLRTSSDRLMVQNRLRRRCPGGRNKTLLGPPIVTQVGSEKQTDQELNGMVRAWFILWQRPEQHGDPLRVEGQGHTHVNIHWQSKGRRLLSSRVFATLSARIRHA